MPADFVPPQFQYPDLMGSYLRGQQGATASAMAPLEIQGAQQGLQLGNQQLQTGALNLDMLRQMMGLRQQALQGYQQTLQGLNGTGQQSTPAGQQPTQTGQQPGGPDGGIQNGPQDAVASQPYNPNDPLAPLLDPRRVAANAAYGQFNAMLSGKDPNEPIAAALKLQAEQRESQVKVSQLHAQGPLALADTVATSANADQLIKNNPSLQQQWIAMAPKLGLDPFKDLTPANARMVARYGYNNLAGSVGLPPKEMPAPLQTTQRGLGESIQTDPITGKVTAGAPAMPTEKYDVGGNLVELPKAVGVAQGLQPHDAGLLAAQQITPQAREQAYQVAKSTGALTEALAGRDPYAQAQIASYVAQRAGEDGISGLSMAAKQQSFKASQKVVDDFTDPDGKAGGALVAINTAVRHVGSLEPLIDALGSGNVTRINQARQVFQRETGIPAPTNFATLANMAVGEINKAVTANGGDKEERERLGAPFDPKGGPAVLKGAVQTAVSALAGKTDALRNAWDVGTNGTQGPFDKFLLPDTKKALGITDSGAPVSPGQSQTINGFTVTRIK
jgi:hypothetical protein